MMVPPGMRYLSRFSPESLRYQLPMLIGAPVVLRSSIQSLGPVGELASTSLTITEPLAMTDSSRPGVPKAAVDGCQAAAVLHVDRSVAPGLLITSESPLPSVEGYQASEYVNSCTTTLLGSSMRMISPLLSNEPLYCPAMGMPLP